MKLLVDFVITVRIYKLIALILQYEKGQLVLCDVMEKVKDAILVSSLTRTTKTVVGRSPVIRAHAAPTALPEAKNRVAKRTKHVQGSGNDKNPTI